MAQVEIDDVLRQLALLDQARAQLVAQLSALHRDVLELLVTSPKNRVAHGAASQRLVRTLADARQAIETHGGKF